MYYGDRGVKFYNLIFTLFKRAKLDENFILLCLNNVNNIKKFGDAFTSVSANSKNNYEFFEQIGDSTLNKFIVSYMYNRFPQLKSSSGVNVVARLKIKYGSKGQLFQIAEQLGFWNYISADDEERIKRKKSLLEDVFEAFIGCFEEIINDTIHQIKGQYFHGVGYDICFTLLTSIFDELSINIHYEALVDAKTRLKELFDEQRNILIKLRYEDVKCPDTNYFISKVYNDLQFLGSGTSPLKKEAQEKAADSALQNLKKKGFIKDIPLQYTQFR